MELPSPDRSGGSRVHAEWAARVHAEYRSAATTARTVHLVIACGLPDPLASAGLRVVQDELDHARLSHETLVALGGQGQPVDVDVGELLGEGWADGPLAALVDLAVRVFCLGESFAVPLFRAMREHTTHDQARATLDRVLRDEARHRALGWDLLDALLQLDPDGVRARVQDQLPAWLAGYRQAYAGADLDQAEPLAAHERAAGLLDPGRYHEIHDRCLAEDIAPRFAARGIALPG